MSYLVLARKYRPQRFAELVGQEHVARTLTNAILQNRVHHAFLFTGARGVGKTSAARILAKALCCEQGDAPTPEPCGVCEQCQEIAGGRSVDIIEIGADDEAVRVIARQAAGSVRDGLSLLDQVIAYVGDAKLTRDVVADVLGVADRRLLVELAGHVLARDTGETLRSLSRAADRGVD